MKDVFNDANFAKLSQMAQQVAIPDYVMDAPPANEQPFEKVATELFADQANRRYPLDTKSNTWLSRTYFQMDKEAYDKDTRNIIQKKIDEAVDFWDVEPLRLKASLPIQKKAHVIPLTMDGNGKDVIHEVKVDGKEAFMKIASDMYDSMEKLSYDNRRELARGLMHTPEEYKAPLDEQLTNYLEKAAGFGMNTRENVGKAVISRVVMLDKQPEYADKLTAFATALPAKMTPALLQKVASVIDVVDRECGLRRYYGRGLEIPEEAVFAFTEKEAAEIIEEAIPLMNGNTIHKTAIVKDDKGVIDNFFQSYYGEIPYSNMEEKIANIQALPRPDADALQKLTGLK